METQILNLKEPHEYICCNGRVALHIATLIVYEAKVNEDGKYELKTHSLPVVKNFETPSGTVWNRAELRDCDILCREDNPQISLRKFRQILSRYPVEHRDRYPDLIEPPDGGSLKVIMGQIPLTLMEEGRSMGHFYHLTF